MVNRQTGIRNDSPERADANLFVIWDNNPGIRFVTPKNHVASGLTAKNEAYTFKSRTNLSAGKICRERWH
jgi:hypothetical protein